MAKIKPRYVCELCGKMFNEPDYIQECVGEFWGSPAYDTFPVSPCCGSEYYDTEEEGKDDSDRGTAESTKEV